MPKNDYKYIFITGTGRCGTNILKKILNQNEQVYSLPFEYRFTIDPDGIVELYNTLKNSWSPYLVHKKLNMFETFMKKIGKKNVAEYLLGRFIKSIDKSGKLITPPRYFDWELEKWFPNYFVHLENFLQKIVDFNYNASWPGEDFFQLKNKMHFVANKKNIEIIFGDYLRALYDDILARNQKKFFIEDNTWSILYAHELVNILPEVRIIHIYRDPRDVVVSFMKQRWTPDEFEKSILYYSAIMDKIIKVKEMVDNGNIIDIKFENLVMKRAEILMRVCNFCGLEYTNNMNDIDLSQNNIGRWNTELTPKEKDNINEKLLNYINYLNYN